MITDLIRPHLKSFKPYVSARSEVQQAHTFLDANELSLGSPVEFDGVALNRYPDPSQHVLRDKIAARLGVSRDMIFAGVGSDEIIDLLVRLFCEPPKDSIVIHEPTYGVYRVSADLNNVGTISIPLDDRFQLDPERTLAGMRAGTKIVFLCSPNNPTGNLLSREKILSLCRQLDALVVVDEAYVEFAEGKGDLTGDVAGHGNLVVLRTLSKAWGLAGIRLGYCIANPEIVSYLLRIKAPYNLNAATLSLADQALDNDDFVKSAISTIVRERTRLERTLRELRCVVRVWPSDANFLLVEFENAITIYETLSRKGIIVRRRSEPALRNSLRLTVGTPDENDLLTSTLRENP